ncbi:HU family DNA-binding protein [Fangia hongkongensis]|uniref:HU family DNA-binding protein n=1 Tax=Fangia hongkongensis TaxID=270495 RepID=UPI0003731FE2|nr:HU family DNA-binding protein [Fangia hongkongensis]MBK2124053.1 HU family DNA-binding protein [Fangia hongkongensis]
MAKKSQVKSYSKDEFLNLVKEKSGLTKADATKALNAVFDSLEEVLAKGDRVSFVGYGSFEVGHRAARDGRNPQTGQKIKIKASNVVKFSPGKVLKEAVNK